MTDRFTSTIVILLRLVYLYFVSPYGVGFFCCNQKGFSFSLKVFLSQLCPSFLEFDFACLSLEMSIQLFFFLFLFSSYVCSVDACVVRIVFGICNHSSSAYFYVVFLTYQCIDTVWLARPFPPSFHDTYSLRSL